MEDKKLIAAILGAIATYTQMEQQSQEHNAVARDDVLGYNWLAINLKK